MGIRRIEIKPLILGLAAALFVEGSAHAGQICGVTEVRKQGKAVEVQFRSDLHVNIWVTPSDRYVMQAGKLTRWSPTPEAAQDAPLRLELGSTAHFDFGSHHSTCSLTVVEVDGKLAIRLNSWDALPNMPARQSEEMVIAKDADLPPPPSLPITADHPPPIVIQAGEKAVLEAGQVAYVPDTFVVYNPKKNATVKVKGQRNVIHTEVGSVVTVAPDAKGPAHNIVFANWPAD